MDIISTQKFARVTPKKMRVVADVARKLAPLESLDKLPFLRRKGADVLLKVVKSAITNAKQKGLSDDALIFKEIQIGEGPRLKRGRAASRGRWHPYKRRMSHVRVVLTTRKSDLPAGRAGIRNSKSEKIDEMDKTVKTEASNVANETRVSKARPIKTVGNIFKSVVFKKGDKT